MKELLTHGKAEAGRRLCREEAAGHGEQRACQRTAEHLKPDIQNIRRLTARYLDELGELRHIIRQPQVKIDLRRHQHRAQQRHQRLLPAHPLE